MSYYTRKRITEIYADFEKYINMIVSKDFGEEFNSLESRITTLLDSERTKVFLDEKAINTLKDAYQKLQSLVRK